MLKLIRYFEQLARLSSANSTLGHHLQLFSQGLVPIPGRTDSFECELVRLCDTSPELARLTPRDLRVLAVYALGCGGFGDVSGIGGATIGRYSLGVDHVQAAKLLRIRGRNPARTAMRWLAVAQEHLII